MGLPTEVKWYCYRLQIEGLGFRALYPKGHARPRFKIRGSMFRVGRNLNTLLFLRIRMSPYTGSLYRDPVGFRYCLLLGTKPYTKTLSPRQTAGAAHHSRPSQCTPAAGKL